MRNKPLLYSLLVHLVVFLLVFVGVPSFWRPAQEEIAISLELLPVSNKSNVKPKKVETKAKKGEIDKHVPKAAKPKEEVGEEKKKEVEQKPVLEEKPKEAEIKLKEKKKEQQKKEEKKEEQLKKKEAKKEKEKKKAKKEKSQTDKNETDDFDALLKSLEESTTTKEIKETKKKQPSKDLQDLESELNDLSDSNNYDNSAPLSMNEKDAIRSQIEKNWNVPAGAKDAHNLKVTLRISIQPDGTVTQVKVVASGMNSNSFYKVAADSAVRAVYRASPLQNLPVEKYSSWKEIELTFDPSSVLY